ncbi:GNAT family N-acetyltransferase [Lichenihabitans psoromatis]|uniref:GNAT family N-acetyltransferase n=1 Tax=Lichenihabitans psoromatis TaxID=2528642 RepID=UPI00103642AF|nr:N-acetyltransferase [Lichenihabitans psoromatis]
MSDAVLSLSIVVAPEGASDAQAVERLNERAFGPGRFARTAYRLREMAEAPRDLSFVARVSTLLVGANRLTPIRCGTAPALLLGPLTVDPAFRSRGVARSLVDMSLAAAKQQGHKLVILIGDEAYYKRYGFTRVPPGRLTLPGPVDPARLLVLELESGAFEGVSGSVGA